MALEACRIKRCDNLYSGDETLIRFINYFRRHHWLEQNVRLRGLSENALFCIFIIFDDVLLMSKTNAIEYCFPCTQKIAMTMTRLSICSHRSWPLMSLMILAIDFSQYLATPPPPPPPQKKVLGNRIVLHVTCTTLSSVIKYIMLYPH